MKTLRKLLGPLECGHRYHCDTGSGEVTWLPVYRVELFFRWYDLWVGAYWDKKNSCLYICPIPTVGVVLRFGIYYGMP